MAQKAGHTPGPWDYDAADFTIYSVEPYGTIIGHSHYEPVIEANACLIAAAPDLLEALVTLVEAEPGKMTRKMWDDARADIAKATTA